MIKSITEFLFGKRIHGEKVRPIKTNTLNPDKLMSYNEWCQLLKVGSLYTKTK